MNARGAPCAAFAGTALSVASVLIEHCRRLSGGVVAPVVRANMGMKMSLRNKRGSIMKSVRLPNLPIALFILAGSVLGGCASGVYTPPVATTPTIAHERTIHRSFDDTWSSLIEYASGTFFAIDNFEKESGLMTLSFGSNEPENFIDCGHMKASSLTRNVDMPYVSYLVQNYGARLDGKMNVVVKAVDSGTTQVRVNARYVFSTLARADVPAQSWVFDSGGQATIMVSGKASGTIPSRTCRPTHEIETKLLDAIDR